MDEEAKIAQDRQKQINDISNYKKLEKIGEGTYGIVYRCKYLPTGQYVAMKKFRLGDEEEGIPPTRYQNSSKSHSQRDFQRSRNLPAERIETPEHC